MNTARSCILLMLSSLLTCVLVSSAEAKLTKYYYLKSVGGVWAFKSKVACEKERNRLNRALAGVKTIRPGGRAVPLTDAKCLNYLPQGYQRPYPK